MVRMRKDVEEIGGLLEGAYEALVLVQVFSFINYIFVE